MRVKEGHLNIKINGEMTEQEHKDVAFRLEKEKKTKN